MGDKQLTVTEAQALGVPYGTTQKEAIGISPLSVAARGTLNQITNSIPLIDKLGNLVTGLNLATSIGESVLRGSQLTAAGLLPASTAGQYKSQANAFVSLITRALGEKGTLAEGDVARIRAALPGFYDTIESAKNKLDNLRDIMTEVYNRSKAGYYESYGGNLDNQNNDPLGLRS